MGNKGSRDCSRVLIKFLREALRNRDLVIPGRKISGLLIVQIKSEEFQLTEVVEIAYSELCRQFGMEQTPNIEKRLESFEKFLSIFDVFDADWTINPKTKKNSKTYGKCISALVAIAAKYGHGISAPEAMEILNCIIEAGDLAPQA